MQKEIIQTDKTEDDSETSKLYEEFLRSKPIFADKDSAIAAARVQLEKIAANSGATIDAYLKEAHTTMNSTGDHTLALQLERQINFLRR